MSRQRTVPFRAPPSHGRSGYSERDLVLGRVPSVESRIAPAKTPTVCTSDVFSCTKRSLRNRTASRVHMSTSTLILRLRVNEKPGARPGSCGTLPESHLTLFALVRIGPYGLMRWLIRTWGDFWLVAGPVFAKSSNKRLHCPLWRPCRKLLLRTDAEIRWISQKRLAIPRRKFQTSKKSGT